MLVRSMAAPVFRGRRLSSNRPRPAFAQATTPPGDPAAASRGGRQEPRRGRQPDLQDRPGRDRRLVRLFRLPPLSRRLPCLPRPRRRWARATPRRLVDSMKRMNYTDFLEVVASGRQNVGAGKENVMPAFGTNLNVMCYIDDIYIYLRARAQGDLPRGRPAKRADKPAAYAEAENRSAWEADAKLLAARRSAAAAAPALRRAGAQQRARRGDRARRSEGVPRLRRPAQHALLERGGGRLRAEACRVPRAKSSGRASPTPTSRRSPASSAIRSARTSAT